ncbi:MAG: hypothetical protein ACI828_000329 [Flavobacteriales bacterium]|jgi:hypothetical protein
MKSLLLLALLMIFSTAIAQETWSVSFSPSLHFPTRKVFKNPLRIGNGVDVTVAYSLGNQSKIFAGFIWNRFDRDQGFEEENIEFVQRGVVFGGMYFFKVVPNQKSPFYVRGALTFMDVKARSANDTFNVETQWGIGTLFGLGVKIETFKNWYVMPELRYGNMSNEYDDRGAARNLSFGHVSITGGLMYAF